MRIIAGEFRSRRLYTPEDDTVARPIPDRVKESLFGILRGHTEGAEVFDAFAGTGAIGLEALSRGAASCVFVERDRYMAKLLAANIELLGVGDRAEVVHGDALGVGALARCPRPLRLAFFDPPYALVRDPIGFRRVMGQLAKIIDLLRPDGYACLRTPCPLWLESQPAAVAASPRPRRKRRKPPRRSTDPEAWADPDPEQPTEPEGGITPGATKVEPAIRTCPDLTIPNAAGPETHEYGGMAIHLYMKKRVA